MTQTIWLKFLGHIDSLTICKHVTKERVSKFKPFGAIAKTATFSKIIYFKMASRPLVVIHLQFENIMSLVNLHTIINKSNSTAGVVQVEANLQEQLSDHLHFRPDRAT